MAEKQKKLKRKIYFLERGRKLRKAVKGDT